MTARPDGPGDTPDDDGDGTSDADLAKRWNEIVAELGDLGRESESPGRTDPADPARDGGLAVTYPVTPAVDAGRQDRDRPPLTGRDWEGTDQIDAAEAAVDDHEHFVPPDPGPVFAGDPLLTMAWLGAAGIPIALLVVVIAWRAAPPVLLQAAGIVFALCCVLLVRRMPHRRDEADDDPGAVV